ncbi:hypothetical protein CCP3SC1AL1_520012 [Gammaproteobacteria bacterium]
MKIEIKIEFLKIGKEKVTKQLLKKEKELPNSTIRALEGIMQDIKNYFAMRMVKISEPKCFVNTREGLRGIIRFELAEVMRHKITPEMQTSVVMKAFERDMANFCKILRKFYKDKKIDAEVTSEIVKDGRA